MTGNGNGRGSGETDKDQLIEQLREAVRARDEFVVIAAHELRNPMTPILMRVSLLLAAAKDPVRCRPEVMAPRLEALEHVVREFIRRATMLLDVSRITTGNLRLAPTETDLSRTVAPYPCSSLRAMRPALWKSSSPGAWR